MTTITKVTAASLMENGEADGYTVISKVSHNVNNHTLVIKDAESLVEYVFSLDLLNIIPDEIELEAVPTETTEEVIDA